MLFRSPELGNRAKHIHQSEIAENLFNLFLFTGKGRKTYGENTPRQVSRYLTDVVLTQIADDIRETYEPEWNRRGMWNKSYFEARVPEVPTMLLELLSHQNFADMRYGLDPRFRFLVSRAIYKGILKFIAEQNDYEYQVQPLPVNHLRTEFIGTHEIKLTWRAVEDPLEPTATPEKYIVYTRIGNGAFDSGTLVSDTSYTKSIIHDSIYSFKVTDRKSTRLNSSHTLASRMPSSA